MVINLSNLFNVKKNNSKISDFQDLEHLDGLAISVVMQNSIIHQEMM